ncbi:hypothetical protein GCK72_025134 [Caenorhabditis remanei]|uniref:Uncharacterized protein n=1 Tax=Caenorhabditis remanei TaxID=31234 RepID=A0A6A5G137_CAERE|nr:hypothetical protein GCK72_025134 [Caenorhabditis remanei]KAF1748667.1 hypothetical protein GCK72_025134 [Caenorhabditis remanei]
MFVLLTLALVCAAAASSGYGAPTYNQPAPTYRGSAPSYGSYGSYSSESSSSSEEHHRRRCKKLKDLDIDTALKSRARDAKFSPLERKGKHYTKISCPNDGKKYALLGDKTGAKVTIGSDDNNNSIVLAEGVNIDLVAKCNGKRTHVKLANGDRVRIRKVACVQLDGAITAF